MECLALKRKYKSKNGIISGFEYLIANGMGMGRWTSHFGVHCLADTYDTKEYLKSIHKESKEPTYFETYTVSLNN